MLEEYYCIKSKKPIQSQVKRYHPKTKYTILNTKYQVHKSLSDGWVHLILKKPLIIEKGKTNKALPKKAKTVEKAHVSKGAKQ